MKRTIVSTILTGAIWTAAGCDDKPTPLPPPATQTSPPRSSTPAPPTTQAILAARRSPRQLGGLPLEITVPDSWKFTRGEIPLLKGLAPGGEIAIRFSEPRRASPLPTPPPTLTGIGVSTPTPADTPEPGDPVSYSKDQVDAIIANARDQLTREPKRYLSADVRAMENGARVLDRVHVEPAIAASQDAQGALPGIPEGIKWTVTVYAPFKQRFRAFELSFVDLSHQQFTADSGFLHEIVASLRYDPVLMKDTGSLIDR